MSRRDPPEVRQRRGSPAPIPGKCAHHLSLTDPPRYCTRPPKKGRQGCRVHGGNALRGIAHPQYKTGLYSAHLPPPVARTYEALLEDEALLSLRQEIAVARAYLTDRLSRLRDGHALGRQALALIGTVVAAGNAFTAARQSGSAVRLKQTAEALMTAIVALGVEAVPLEQERETLAEFTRTALVLERLARSENLSRIDAINSITAAQAWALQQAETRCFTEALDELVPDPALRKAIRQRVTTKFAELAHRRAHPLLGAGRRPGDPAGDPAAAD